MLSLLLEETETVAGFEPLHLSLFTNMSHQIFNNHCSQYLVFLQNTGHSFRKFYTWVFSGSNRKATE
jgi:hypothetical protein